MAAKFTTKGYIEVWWQSPSGLVYVSRHRSTEEATESASAHADLQGGTQTYELRYPNKTVVITGITPTPPPSEPPPSNPVDEDWLSRSTAEGVQIFVRANDFATRAEFMARLLAWGTDTGCQYTFTGAVSGDARRFDDPVPAGTLEKLGFDTTNPLTGGKSFFLRYHPTDTNSDHGPTFEIPIPSPVPRYYVQFSLRWDAEALSFDYGGADGGTKLCFLNDLSFQNGQTGILVRRGPRGGPWPIGWSARTNAFRLVNGHSLAPAGRGGEQYYPACDEGGDSSTVAGFDQRFGPNRYNASPTSVDLAAFPRFTAGEWYTITTYVDQDYVSPYTPFQRGMFKLWMARHGEAPKLIGMSFRDVRYKDPATYLSKSIRLAFRTEDAGAINPATAGICVDQVIVSTNPINSPGGFSLPYPGQEIPTWQPVDGTTESTAPPTDPVPVPEPEIPLPTETQLAEVCANLIPGAAASFDVSGLYAVRAGGYVTDNSWHYQCQHYYDSSRNIVWLMADSASSSRFTLYRYDVAANEWSLHHVGDPPTTFGATNGHVWDEKIFDFANNRLLYQCINSQRFWALDLTNPTLIGGNDPTGWTYLGEATPPANSSASGQHGIALHQNLYGTGEAGIVVSRQRDIIGLRLADMHSGNGGVIPYTIIHTGRTSTGDNTAACYVPGLDAVICGGGRLDPGGTGHQMHRVDRHDSVMPLDNWIPTTAYNRFLGSYVNTFAGGYGSARLVPHPNGQTVLVLGNDRCNANPAVPSSPASYQQLAGTSWVDMGPHPLRGIVPPITSVNDGNEMRRCGYGASGACAVIPSLGALMYFDFGLIYHQPKVLGGVAEAILWKPL